MSTTEMEITKTDESPVEQRSTVARMRKRLTTALSSRDSRRSVTALLDQAVLSGTTLLTSVVVGRVCGKHELGLFALGLTLLFFIRTLQDNLIATPYSVGAPKRSGRKLSIYSASTLIHQLLFVAAVFLAILGGAAFLQLAAPEHELTPVLWSVLCILPFVLMHRGIRFFLLAHLDVRRVFILDATLAVAQMALLMLLGMVGRLSVTTACVAMGVAAAIASVGWRLGNRPELLFSQRAVKRDWAWNWSLGKWAVGGMLLGSSTPYFMPWIVLSFHGEAATGMLAACVAITGVGRMFVAGIGNFIFPRASHAYQADGMSALISVLRNSVMIFVVTLGTITFVTVFFAGWILTTIYGAEFADVASALPIMCGSVLVYSVGNTAGIGLWAVERGRANFLADAVILLSTVTVAIALVPSLAVVGAAVAMLVSSVLGAVCRIAKFLRVASGVQHDSKPAVIG